MSLYSTTTLFFFPSHGDLISDLFLLTLLLSYSNTIGNTSAFIYFKIEMISCEGKEFTPDYLPQKFKSLLIYDSQFCSVFIQKDNVIRSGRH